MLGLRRSQQGGVREKQYTENKSNSASHLLQHNPTQIQSSVLAALVLPACKLLA